MSRSELDEALLSKLGSDEEQQQASTRQKHLASEFHDVSTELAAALRTLTTRDSRVAKLEGMVKSISIAKDEAHEEGFRLKKTLEALKADLTTQDEYVAELEG